MSHFFQYTQIEEFCCFRFLDSRFMFIIVILYILRSALFYVVFKYFSSYNNIYLFQSHAEKKNQHIICNGFTDL